MFAEARRRFLDVLWCKVVNPPRNLLEHIVRNNPFACALARRIRWRRRCRPPVLSRYAYFRLVAACLHRVYSYFTHKNLFDASFRFLQALRTLSSLPPFSIAALVESAIRSSSSHSFSRDDIVEWIASHSLYYSQARPELEVRWTLKSPPNFIR